MTLLSKLHVLIIVDGIQVIYEDMMYMVRYGLDVQNIPSTYLYYHVAIEKGLLKNDEETQCVFFGTKYLHHSVHIPHGSIITDFDHLHWIWERLNKDLIQHNTIMTFSTSIADYILQQNPQASVKLFQFGYSKYLDFGYDNAPQYKYDICFLGTMSPRRSTILDKLKEKYRCYIHQHITKTSNKMTTELKQVLSGIERAIIYKQSKIVLSISFLDEYTINCNASRIFPAVSTGAFVISERCLDEEQNKSIDQICVNVDLADLHNTIDEYLSNDEKRETKRLEYYNFLKGGLIPPFGET